MSSHGFEIIKGIIVPSSRGFNYQRLKPRANVKVIESEDSKTSDWLKSEA
jgi:hypothetical protein